MPQGAALYRLLHMFSALTKHQAVSCPVGSAAEDSLDQGHLPALHYPGHHEHCFAAWQIHPAAGPPGRRQIYPAQRPLRPLAQDQQC